MRNKNIVAVDLGGTNLRVAVVARDGTILEKLSAKVEKEGDLNVVVVEQIISNINRLKLENIGGIGVDSAGRVDSKRGVIMRSSNIGISNVKIAEILSDSFGLPTYVINDANAAAIAEKYFGLGRNIDNFVYITMSTGIGSGVFVDGKLLEGVNGDCGEVGHIAIANEYGLKCNCGSSFGHWESVASGKGIPKFFQKWLKKNSIAEHNNVSAAEDIFKLAKKGDSIATKFLDELGKINGRAFSAIIAVYDPELIVLGGSVAFNNGNEIKSCMLKHIDPVFKVPKIEITNFGDEVSLLGAAAYAFSKIDK